MRISTYRRVYKRRVADLGFRNDASLCTKRRVVLKSQNRDASKSINDGVGHRFCICDASWRLTTRRFLIMMHVLISEDL